MNRPLSRPNNKSNSPSSRNRRPSSSSKSGKDKKWEDEYIEPSLMIKKAVASKESEFVPTRTFEEMPIDVRLIERLHEKGYKYPTQIQDQTLEHLMAGHDLMGIAQTGTGKTAAFLVPLIDELLHHEIFNQTLVVVPTRELALQVEEEFRSMTKGLRLFSACFIGGTNINTDIHILRRPNHIIVGTPGRLLDLYTRGVLDLGDFPVLVLDEFDRMLDMGFAPDMNRIREAMVSREQTLLFSASVDPGQESLIAEILTDPIEVRVSSGESTADHVEQDIIRIAEGESKFGILIDMLRHQEFEKVLVFAETKRWVHRITMRLRKAGIRAEQIHGGRSQGQRKHALDKFRAGRIQVLVATDVAARGLDVLDVTHVINYMVPRTFDSYLHRVGRTGRAGKTGKAFTFVRDAYIDDRNVKAR